MSKKPFNAVSRRDFLKYASMIAAGTAIAVQGGRAIPRILAQEPDPSLKGTLVFWGHGDHPLNRIREAFLKKYPSVNLDWQQLQDFAAKFQTAMAAGTGAPDLYWAEAFQVQQYGSQG